jgi:hypothetical protein
MKINNDLINWNGMPSWAKFIATDKKGRVHCYSEKPVMVNGEFVANGGISGQIENIPIKNELLTTCLFVCKEEF